MEPDGAVGIILYVVSLKYSHFNVLGPEAEADPEAISFPVVILEKSWSFCVTNADCTVAVAIGTAPLFQLVGRVILFISYNPLLSTCLHEPVWVGVALTLAANCTSRPKLFAAGNRIPSMFTTNEVKSFEIFIGTTPKVGVRNIADVGGVGMPRDANIISPSGALGR